MCDGFSLIKEKELFLAKIYRYILDERNLANTMENMVKTKHYDSFAHYALIFGNKVVALKPFRTPFLFQTIRYNFYNGFQMLLSCVQHFSRLLGALDNKNKNKNENNKVHSFLLEYFTLNFHKTMSKNCFVKYLLIYLISTFCICWI